MTSHQKPEEEQTRRVGKMDHVHHAVDHQGFQIALGAAGGGLLLIIILVACYKSGLLRINPDPEEHTGGIRASIRRRCGKAGPCCERVICDTVSPSPSEIEAADAHMKFLAERKKKKMAETPIYVLKKPKV
ncbi:hypothetical protein LOTGIDRAFT_229976 [Lottia gigantea]|uniref:Uncharacterized protein n=1 Tax=Lottia gigantea TaxID=225164 RepID=V4BBH5_LOTGI|nr:hypothetical protein LOTGIDRAFT_229976 [Lottia gigantea]ESP04896.1 hypothetical protein LOTGIDRAFT_229976 [Lottia gigantea]